ncbi:MFS transporter [Paraburkholderia sediminicola]|uniref:MFS transporter n=1 Tax=Paraburkholderia sediminicola TaxID=458836 RepID=UPI0038BC4296
MGLPLLALAIAAFGIGTTEFVILGMLPDVAHSLQISIPQTGMLVSGYALGVVIGGPVLVVALARLPRKATLLCLVAIFIIGNFACAFAPGFRSLMVARVLTAFCHAAFFGTAVVVVSELVPVQRRTQAISLVFAGVTLANVLGVPFGTMLGQTAGWRSTFFAVALIGIGALVALQRWLPDLPADKSPQLMREFSTLRSRGIWIALGMSVLASISMFTLFTYVAPILQTVSGVLPERISGVLLLCGIALTLGNLAGGKLADWRLVPSLLGIFAALVVVLGVFSFTSGYTVAAICTLVTWSAIAFAASAPLQAYVVRQAKDAPRLASTLNIGAFNLGNAIGAWLGGKLIAAGWPMHDLPLVAALVAAAAFGATVYANASVPGK